MSCIKVQEAVSQNLPGPAWRSQENQILQSTIIVSCNQFFENCIATCTINIERSQLRKKVVQLRKKVVWKRVQMKKCVKSWIYASCTQSKLIENTPRMCHWKRTINFCIGRNLVLCRALFAIMVKHHTAYEKLHSLKWQQFSVEWQPYLYFYGDFNCIWMHTYYTCFFVLFKDCCQCPYHSSFLFATLAKTKCVQYPSQIKFPVCKIRRMCITGNGMKSSTEAKIE